MKHLLILACTYLIPLAIVAQSPDPFYCAGSDGFGYYTGSASSNISSGSLTYSSSRISKITTTSGERTTLCSAESIGVSLNGLAFNPHDNFLYAVSRFDATEYSGKLYRLGSNCQKLEIPITGAAIQFSTNHIGTVDAAGGNIGSATFDLDNHYYVSTSFTNIASSGFINKLQTISIDGDNATVETTVSLTCPSCTGYDKLRVTDLIFDEASSLLYGSNRENNKLYSIDPSTGVLIEIGATGLDSSILGIYKNRNGNVRAMSQNGNIYSVDLNTGTFTLLTTLTTWITSNGDGASGCYAPPKLSGRVFLDHNGLSDNTVNGIGINLAGSTPLYAHLIKDGIVMNSQALASDGSYEFLNLFSGTYEVQISSTQGIIGASIPEQNLPSEYVFVGDHIGINPGNDGSTNGRQLVTIANGVDIEEVNFGIESRPVTTGLTTAIQENPNHQIQVTVPELTFSDLEDTDINNITIVSIPDPSTQGILYYDGTPVTPNQTIPNYVPTLLTVDPIDGVVTMTFTFITTDMANINSNESTVEIPFNSTALPVSLSRFFVKNNQEQNIITWYTASEINVDFFSLERSSNHIDFREMNSLTAFGNTSSQKMYSSIDPSPSTITYYRLKIVDFDGKHEYSKVISVENSRSTKVIVYPTLVGEILNIDIQSEDEQLYSITNSQGKTVMEGQIHYGSNTLEIETLAKGVYFISIGKNINTISIHKFIKM